MLDEKRPMGSAVRAVAGLGILLLAGGCAAGSGRPAAAPAAPLPAPGSPEVLWDTWGVPHVFGATDEDLFFGHGWAQAQAHGDLLLRLYGEARGRAAEYWGEDHLDTDRWVWTTGIPGRAEAWLDAQAPEARGWIDAFAAGVNAYAREHPERIADDMEPVLPVTAADVLAHAQRVIHFTFVVSPQAVLGAARRWEEGADESRGSNAWAVAPERSATGNAMLLANPHLPWSDLFTWFEVQLTGAPGAGGDDAMNAYGAALVGTPFLGIAFNDHLGWTHTVNTLDGYDLYELELAPGGYRWGGEVRPFETRERTLRVRAGDGTMREEELTLRSSVHGPVVSQDGDRALALRVAGLDAAGLLEQYWRMARARDLASFEDALRALQMPMFTVMYADRDGHVLHLFNGRVPVLPDGPWDFSGVVPGTGPESLWTETYGYERLPRVLDPLSGWLQNANDPPWTTTFPRALDPDEYPDGMAPRFMHFRAQRSARMLLEDESIELDELVAYKHSTRMELADRILDDLAAAVDGHGDEDARGALAVLSSWDREADADSRGAVLFERFAALLRRSGPDPYAVPWSPDAALDTPDGLADPAAAAAALSRAAREVEDEHGSLDVPWGEVHRLRVADLDLPGNGGPGQLGIFRVVAFAPDRRNGGRRAVAGDSFVAAIEFSDPVRARALLSYGNASQPGSPHAGDQLELFVRKELRPVWRTRQEVEAHLSRREVLTREGPPGSP